MKTQKQLPDEFTFICDENSREQLEKLGVDIGSYRMSHNGAYYVIENNKIMWNCFEYKGDKPLINLSDYIDQEQPEPKWQEKIRAEYSMTALNAIVEQINSVDDYETLGIITRKLETLKLHKELEEVRAKEKAILEKIEELKTK